mmetsp:Transcript_32125/g.66494  ORF Transcript_32125/g.66494 Transcript_32125/m.66494 type:complete len:163 (-) Transcript_32125:179-667(-)
MILPKSVLGVLEDSALLHPSLQTVIKNGCVQFVNGVQQRDRAQIFNELRRLPFDQEADQTPLMLLVQIPTVQKFIYSLMHQGLKRYLSISNKLVGAFVNSRRLSTCQFVNMSKKIFETDVSLQKHMSVKLTMAEVLSKRFIESGGRRPDLSESLTVCTPPFD